MSLNQRADWVKNNEVKSKFQHLLGPLRLRSKLLCFKGVEEISVMWAPAPQVSKPVIEAMIEIWQKQAALYNNVPQPKYGTNN